MKLELTFDERGSESPFIDMIWRTRSERASKFMSEATRYREMVVTQANGVTSLAVRGPDTRATIAYCPPDAEFMGIIFKMGTFMPDLPTTTLANAPAIIPEATQSTFWLHHQYWEFPTYENADTFVNHLVRQGLLVQESLVGDVLEGRCTALSRRSVQRRFLRATGMPYGVYNQIERAQQAVTLLQQGASILDTVEQVGYADQPHLTRSLRRFMGQTPVQIAQRDGTNVRS